jgi:putative ABC transport system permease protein
MNANYLAIWHLFGSNPTFTTTMIKNYFKTAWRNIVKNKFSSFINIGGLAVGMGVSIMIGLWVWDEISFDRYHKNYDRIAQVKQHVTNNGEVQTWATVPFPLANVLRKNYGSDFKSVAMVAERYPHLLSLGDKKISKEGGFFEPQAPDMFTLKMLKGSRAGLNNPASILLSESAAKAFFGKDDPMNQVLKIDNNLDVKVTGVFEDLPDNSTLNGINFMAPWDLYYSNTEWIRTASDPWRPNSFQLFVQLAENADLATVSVKIKDEKLKNVNPQLAKKKPVLFLQPMSEWHLYSDFKNGVNIGGRIKYVWLFGIIGAFVLLLACINFMNLSTARSEKRAKEAGIRKAIGSLRAQLILQFFTESLVVVIISYLVSLALVQILISFFNGVAGKNMTLPWGNPVFWALGIGFCLITGLIAGSYPAFYFSSFRPVKILKGTFRVGRWASMPRKVLVVLQFTVSVIMIIGTLIVFRQIQFAKDRPVGYENTGLITLPVINAEIHKHFDAVKRDLVKEGVILSIAEAASPVTETFSSSSGFSWRGKDPNLSIDFPRIDVSYDYGKTINWQIKEGRDFSRDFATDSSAIILNEAAAKFMGFQHAVGETVKLFDRPFTVIGVVKDIIMQNPYEQVKPTVFNVDNGAQTFVIARINPLVSAGKAVAEIKDVFKKYNPGQPVEYSFVDESYSRKFGGEERLGTLTGFFTILAIFISCLGLFGMASFVAEQRTKEIGIRKVLGASVVTVWRLLSKDFMILVIISLLIAIPVAWYFMNDWLQNFQYRTTITWWVFAVSGAGALLITLLTVSFQTIKAALGNPAKSLRSE